MKKDMKKYLKKYLCPLGLLLVMTAVTLICRPMLYLNDDVYLRSIISGAYTGTPEGHAIHMQYPLSGILALLYRMVPMLPWFELFFAGCIWFCMAIVAQEFENKLFGILVSVMLFLPFYCCMHYTTSAAVAASGAVFLFCKGKKVYSGAVLWWIAYVIRVHAALLALPFVGAALVWRWVIASKEDRKEVFIKCAKQAGILAAGLFCIIGIKQLIFYSGDEWQEYIRYNDNRTQLYDYTDFVSNPTYAERYDELGLSYEEYQLLSIYNIMLDDTIDADRMKVIADNILDDMKKDTTLLSQVKDSVWKYYIQVRYHDKPYNYIWMAVVFLLAGCMIWKKKWLQLFFLGILVVGRSSVWTFLIWQGRFPERVSLSLYTIEFVLLIAMGLYYAQILFENKKQRYIAGYVCGVILLAISGFVMENTQNRMADRVASQPGWEALKEYCIQHEENTYLMDVYSSVRFSDRLYAKDASNLMLLGGWLTTSPLARDRFEELGGSDAAEALYYGENARYVTNGTTDSAWFQEYLQKRFGECSLRLVDEVIWEDGSFLIYEVIGTVP